MSRAPLYTPDMLAAAVELARWPAIENAPLHGAASSRTCGSALGMDLCIDSSGRVTTIGLRVKACAVGQASATIFARHAPGRSLAEVIATHDRLLAWLEDEAPPPDWPDIAMIAPARAFPARHGAIVLPWAAAIDALSHAPLAG